jgi:hypothetical protein
MKPYRPRLSPSSNPLIRLVLCAGVASLSLAAYANKKPEPAKPANQYTAFDTHAQEKVSIAADPCLTEEQCPFFRLPYARHGLQPIRVIITNDGDTALTLEEVRIQFISANHDVIPAATLDDINRRLFSTQRAAGTKIPLTNITIHHAPIDKKITDDDTDFGFPSTTVQAHSTLAGYLFYDIHDLEDGQHSPLKGAQLYLKEIRTLDGKRELFAFTIPLDKTPTK